MASPPGHCGQRQPCRACGTSSDGGDDVPYRGDFPDSNSLASICSRRAALLSPSVQHAVLQCRTLSALEKVCRDRPCNAYHRPCPLHPLLSRATHSDHVSAYAGRSLTSHKLLRSRASTAAEARPPRRARKRGRRGVQGSRDTAHAVGRWHVSAPSSYSAACAMMQHLYACCARYR